MMRPGLPLLALAASLLAGCGHSHPAGRVAQGDREQIMHWGNGADPGDLDPQTEEAETSSHVFNALFEGLVSQDPHDLHPIPGVAASWDISPDAHVYTFHLRPDAKWSNGDPVTARDFVESWHRLLSPALGSQYSQMLYKDAEVVNAHDFYDGKLTDFSRVGLEAPDDRTLVVHLVNPADYFLSMLNHESLYPVHVPTILKYGRLDQKGTAWTRPDNFVGNGPFRLKSWRLQQELVVERSPTYWDAKNVRLREIHYYPTDNLDTEERDFRAGQLHVTYEIPLSKIDYYAKNDPAAYQNSPYLGTYFLRLNTTRPPLTDRRVRRALAMAIDREGIAKTVARGGQRPAYSYVPPDCNGYTSRARIPHGLRRRAPPARRGRVSRRQGNAQRRNPHQHQREPSGRDGGHPADLAQRTARQRHHPCRGIQGVVRLDAHDELRRVPHRLDRRLRRSLQLPGHLYHRRG